MKRYETYKNSGFKWFGNIPASWDVASFKYLVEKIFAGGTPTTSKSEYWADKSFGIPWVAISDITKSDKFLTSTKKEITEEGRQSKGLDVLPSGTLLLSIFASLGKTVRLGINATVNQAILGLLPNHKLKVDYLEYLFIDAERYISYYSSMSTQENLNLSKIRNLNFPIPLIQEQTQIATYLDYKTGLIDAIIAQKEELIKKLKEQRQAIINEAVTKGLNPNVKLKDSGIEWLGDIPEHWEVIKLFGLCHLVRGNSSFKKDELLSNGKYVALQYGKTYKVNEVNEKYKFFVNDEFYKDSQIVNYGDTIIISTSETIEDLGHSVFYKRKDLGLLGGEQLLLKAKSNKINPKYLFYSTKVFLKDLRKNATGVKVYRFNIDDLKNVFTSVPLMLEQNSIVKHIEKKSTTIDKVVLRTQTSIKKLKEYRQSLISEAVTGKIDVRDWQAPKS